MFKSFGFEVCLIHPNPSACPQRRSGKWLLPGDGARILGVLTEAGLKERCMPVRIQMSVISVTSVYANDVP